MKSLMSLTTTVVQDMGDLLGLAVDRDLVTVNSRFEKEGESFLTITLPTFADGFLQSLSEGRLAPSLFPSFGFRGHLPLFLRGFVLRVFSIEGIILKDADSEAVRSVLQICNLWRKLERPVVGRRLENAKSAFILCDTEVGEYSHPADFGLLKACFSELFIGILGRLDSQIANFELIPRHGPGAVAERLSKRDKWERLSWLESLEDVFPSRLYGTHDFCEPPPVVPLRDEPPSRVEFVPKTMKGPRVIAIEPTARQFCQQSVARPLYSSLAHVYPGQLDLFDQKTNQAWAWFGSITGEVATLDLSEASDRLSWPLVRDIIPDGLTHLKDALSATRSTHCELDGRVIPLHKFASMGSALTFPIQSMVFFSIAFLGARLAGHRERPKDLAVSVFGDDIIVPTDSAKHVVRLLESFGLKVNARKSYSTGYYRESCGGEFFLGEDVSYVRVKADPLRETWEPQTIASFREYRNDFYTRGMWRTVRLLDEVFPLSSFSESVPIGFPGLGRQSVLGASKIRTNSRLMREEVRVPAVVPKGTPAAPRGRAGLFAALLELERRDGPARSSAFEAIERSPALAIHRVWTPVTW